MPSIEQHLEQAKHNEAFLAQIDRSKYSDWALTLIFYAGLHHVDAVLASRNIHPGAHPVRDQHVRQTNELLPIAANYLKLKSLSQNARYECLRMKPEEVNAVERKHLNAIKTELAKYFGKEEPPKKA